MRHVLVWVVLTAGCYEDFGAGTGVPLHASSPPSVESARATQPSSPVAAGLSAQHADVAFGIAIEPNDRELATIGWRVEEGPLATDHTWNGPTLAGERAFSRQRPWLRGYVEGAYLSLHDEREGSQTPPTLYKARPSSSTSVGFGLALSPGGDDARFRARAGFAFTHEHDSELGELDTIGVQLSLGFVFHPPLCGGTGKCMTL